MIVAGFGLGLIVLGVLGFLFSANAAFGGGPEPMWNGSLFWASIGFVIVGGCLGMFALIRFAFQSF